ncbi:hypothetical protein SPHINGOT1_80239 [Sphingomonas sp. T1]|nr:hypothetical protein SPHINGOT1_80239 [Sphingomonas sp. T1]
MTLLIMASTSRVGNTGYLIVMQSAGSGQSHLRVYWRHQFVRVTGGQHALAYGQPFARNQQLLTQPTSYFVSPPAGALVT